MLNNHFREFIELLEKNEVKYLIVGAMPLVFTDFLATLEIWIFSLPFEVRMQQKF